MAVEALKYLAGIESRRGVLRHGFAGALLLAQAADAACLERGDDFVGAYREYRWRKWERRIRLDRNDHLWRPTAQWVADRYEDQGTVERVVLIRIFSDTPEPGSGDERVWETIEFYDYDLTTGEQRS